MANLNFWISQSLFNPDHNPLITVDFEGFTSEQWYPYHESLVSVSPVFAITTHYPVEANGREIQYIKTNSYFDDYYNRIHINPAALELGNVASEQTSPVLIWNAYLSSKRLQSIDGIEEGISVSGQPATPLTFSALQERVWNINVTDEGASVINANLVWEFGTDQAQLKITGTRIVAFGFLVDWSKPVNESLAWLTDILQSKSGHEQRRALRIAPRVSYTADLLLYDAERQYFDSVMTGWFSKTFAMPVWNQQQWLKTSHAAGGLIVYCDTTFRNFKANRLAIMRGQTAFENETIEIESILADRLILKRPLLKNWPKGTCLSPAVTAQISEAPQLIKRTDRMMRTSVKMDVTEAVDHSESMPAVIYRNYPVLSEKPNEQKDLTHTFERLFSTLDNQTAHPLRVDIGKAAFAIQQYAWMTHGREKQSQLKSLFYALRGSQKAVWLPTFCDDLTVVSTQAGAANSLTIRWCGYTRFSLDQPGRRDIQIVLKNGQMLYRRIISASEINADTEQIVLDQNFDNINKNTVLSISFMGLFRLSSDTVTIEHINDSDGIAKAEATWRGVLES
jgi:hypothetical protein